MRRGRREKRLCIRNPVEGAVSQVAVCREGKRKWEKREWKLKRGKRRRERREAEKREKEREVRRC